MGEGVTYKWNSSFPPWGYVVLPATKPVLEGKLVVNVMQSPSATLPPPPKDDDKVKLVVHKNLSLARFQTSLTGRSSPEHLAPEAPPATRFVGALRCSFRLLRWRFTCQSLHDYVDNHAFGREDPEMLDGVPRVGDLQQIIGYRRDDVSEARYNYLYQSEVCRTAIKRVYDELDKDINNRIPKAAWVEFSLDMYNLFMPSFYSHDNIRVAEDEWICRATLEKPDFSAFYRFFFDIPLMLMRAESLNEEQCEHFWAFVHRRLFIDGFRNTDNYERFSLSRALMKDREVLLHPPLRRPLLVYRKAQLIVAKKAQAEKSHAYQNSSGLGRQEDNSLSKEEWDAKMASLEMSPQDLTLRRPFVPEGHIFFSRELQARCRDAGYVFSGRTPRKSPHQLTLAANSAMSPHDAAFSTDGEQQEPGDELDELLDYCSDISDGDFDRPDEHIRQRFALVQQRKAARAASKHDIPQMRQEATLKDVFTAAIKVARSPSDPPPTVQVQPPDPSAAAECTDAPAPLNPPRELSPERKVLVRQIERHRMYALPMGAAARHRNMFDRLLEQSGKKSSAVSIDDLASAIPETAARMHALVMQPPFVPSQRLKTEVQEASMRKLSPPRNNDGQAAATNNDSQPSKAEPRTAALGASDANDASFDAPVIGPATFLAWSANVHPTESAPFFSLSEKDARKDDDVATQLKPPQVNMRPLTSPQLRNAASGASYSLPKIFSATPGTRKPPARPPSQARRSGSGRTAEEAFVSRQLIKADLTTEKGQKNVAAAENPSPPRTAPPQQRASPTLGIVRLLNADVRAPGDVDAAIKVLPSKPKRIYSASLTQRNAMRRQLDHQCQELEAALATGASPRPLHYHDIAPTM